MQRLVFHVDVNSAFLSWEAARRVSEGGEDLRLIPSAIGGDRDKRTGVILAKSIPAKKYHINTGEPVAMALRKCPALVLAKPDFHLYTRCSKAFIGICREFAPAVEQFSIDECFLDMTGTEYMYPDPVKAAYELKDRIRDELGFTVNIGVGPNKLLAKVASDFEKPDKVHVLMAEDVPEKLWPLPVSDLFGVGKNTAAKLNSKGIRTVGDLARCTSEYVQSILGMKQGYQLHRSANGLDDSPVSAERAEAKGYSISVTLEDNVTDTQTAKEILLELVDSVASRMRRDGMYTYCIGVTIRSDDFRDRSHQRKLDHPTDITSEVFDISMQLFTELWDRKTPLRLLGVSLTELTKENVTQLSLFDTGEDFEKARNLDRSVDEIRKKYSTGAIVRGSALKSSVKVGKKYSSQMDEEKNK